MVQNHKHTDPIIIKPTLVAVVLAFIFFTMSCSHKAPTQIKLEAYDFHRSVELLTNIMVHDIFSPPVAARVYVYPIITAYEILSQGDSGYISLTGQLKDMPAIPAKPDNEFINLEVAALVGFLEIGQKMIFSEEILNEYRDSLYNSWEAKNPKEFTASHDYGLKVAELIKNWIDEDNYKKTRTMPKFSVDLDKVWRWQPTPPDYMDGIEPHWKTIRTLVIDSSAQFKPDPHPPFLLEPGTPFYTELLEVYDICRRAREKGDESDEVLIAQFWDCNPYVSVHRGHMMFAVKKITPGAHWMGICGVACRKAKTDIPETLAAYVKTSVALFDSFISCWDEKYRSVLTRPETLINQFIDEKWEPLLQTPPFPEYTSGHSVISGAASVALTDEFGDNFEFDDDTETAYGLPVRHFNSFYDASREAAISRLYGGIHYRAAVENGLAQGLSVGRFIIDNLKLRNSSPKEQELLTILNFRDVNE